MIWSEFLERMQEMEISPSALVLHVEYDFGQVTDAVAVTFMDDTLGDEDDAGGTIYGRAG